MAITVEGLDYVKDGQPWCKIRARTDIDVSGLDWVKDGQPWAVFAAFEGAGAYFNYDYTHRYKWGN